MSLHRVILLDQRLRLTLVLYGHFSGATSGQRAKRFFLHRLSTATIYAFEQVSNVANSYLAYCPGHHTRHYNCLFINLFLFFVLNKAITFRSHFKRRNDEECYTDCATANIRESIAALYGAIGSHLRLGTQKTAKSR
jgi:hypothetical protein